MFLLLTASCGLHALPEPLITSPQEMARHLESSAEAPSFLAEARLEYYGDGRARKAKITIMALPPDRLRMDVLSFTDDLLSVLTVNGDRFSYFERGGSDCFTGPLCAAPMVARFPMISEPERLVALLAGTVPLLPEPESEKLEFSRREGLYRLELTAGTTTQIVKIRPDGETVAEVVMKLRKKTVLKVIFDGTLESGGKKVPRTIRLLAPVEDLDLSIEFREVEMGYEFKGDPFTFQCPRGTLERELVCPTEAEVECER